MQESNPQFYASSGYQSPTPKSQAPARISQENLLDSLANIKQEISVKKKRARKTKLFKDSKDNRYAKIEPTGEKISLD